MSVTTAIPKGPILEWCIKPLHSMFDKDGNRQQCANSTRGTVQSDFQTFCCNGDIIDTSRDIWRDLKTNPTFLLENLVCCGLNKEMGGLKPLPADYKHCDEGTPTPLAMLAATNTDNAQPFLVTWASAKGVGTGVTDWVRTQGPSCFWADTAHGVAMETTTVSAATFQSLPSPNPDDGPDIWGWGSKSNSRSSLFQDKTGGSTSSSRRTSTEPTSRTTSTSSGGGVPTSASSLPQTSSPAMSCGMSRGALFASLGILALCLVI